MKLNYLIIPVVAVGTAALGGMVTTSAIDSGWYETIAKPSWTPPGEIIGFVWTVLYALTAASALSVWNSEKSASKRKLLAVLFLANAAINFAWSAVFFGARMIGPAILVSLLLEASVLALIATIRPISRSASIALIPYAAWVAFATFLNVMVWRMN